MENQLEFYKSIVDDAVDAIFISDENGDLVLVNKSSELLTGYNKKELLTKNISSLFPLEVSKQKPINYSALNSKKVLTVEKEIVKKDGFKVPVEIKAKKLPNGNYQSFMRDISERKQIEKEHNLINERYKLLFEYSPTGIIIEDKKGTILDANPFVHKVFGYNNGELIGKHITEIAPPEVAENVYKNIDKIISGKKLSHTVRSKKRDGTKIYNMLYETKINLPDFGEGILSISHDITKQVVTERKLKESEMKFRNIIEHSSNMFYVHTTEHELTYVSPQARYFLDCEPEEALVTWTNFITDNPINKLGFEKTQKAINTGVAQRPYQLELITKKGRILTVEVHESPVVENGKTTNIVGALIDITDKKILESSYKELFEYAPITIAEEDVTELFAFFDELKKNGITDLRKYLDEHPDKVVECIKKIKPIRINNSGLRLYGFKSSKEYRNNFESVFTQTSLNPFKEQIIAFFNGSTTFSSETETIMRTGERKNFIMKIQLKPQTKLGKKIELFSLIDITDKKLAELELKKSKEQLQFAIEGSGVGVWDWDIKLGVTIFNKKWGEILGYSEEEIVSVSNDQLLAFIHPEDKQEASKLIKKHLNGELPTYVNEIRMKHKSDGWKWILTSGKVVEWDGNNNPVRMVGTNLDITERKQKDLLIKKYATEVESLFHLTQEMIQNKNVNEIIKAIPQYIVQASTSTDSASMWAYNEVDRNFEVVSWYGYGNRKIEGFTLPETDTLIGEIHKNKTAIICNDTEKDPRYKKTSTGPNLKTKATLGVPLINENKVEYILFADNFSHIDVFNNEDLRVLQSFANIASIAINNVKLYDKIKNSEIKFRSIFDSVGESIFIHDIETGKIVDVNTKVQKMFGFTYEEALNLAPSDSSSNVYPYTSEEAFKLVKKAKTKGPQLFEWHAKKKNGELFWTEINLRKMKVGNEERIVAVVRDITERKRNEQQIYYQANLLDSANDAIIASSDVVINKKLNHKIEFWNKGAEKLFGWKKNEVLGKNIRDLISLEIMNNSFDNLVQSLLDKGFWSGDTIQYDKYGNKKYIHLSVSAIKENGKIIGTIGVNHDITEKIIAEQAIRENEAKINSIMRGAPIGIGFIKNRILEYVNDQLLLILGYSKEEMIGKNTKIFYESSAEYDKIGKLYEELQSKEIASNEAKVIRKTGDIIEIIITLSPLDKNDLTKGLVFSVLDITEKKKNERIILEERTRYKNLFDNSPIPLWEEDFTDLLNRLNELKSEGVTDLEAYLDSNPAILNELVGLLKIINVNKATLHLYKAKTKDELYKGLDQLFTENSLQVFKQELFTVFNRKKYFASEVEVKTLDDTTKIVDLRLFIDYGNEKNPKGTVLLSTIDISERKKNEEELKKWADVFRYSKWGIVIGSANKTELEIMNPAFAEMHGYTVEELKGKPVEVVFAEEERPKIPGFIKEAYQKGSTSFESVHVKKDGSTFPIFANVTTTKDDKGNLLHRIVNIYDITELKEAREQRKELEISYHDIFDNTSDAIYIQDKVGRFIDINKGVVEMYGYPKESFIGNTPEFLAAEGKNDLKKVSKYIKKAFNNKPQQFEFWGKKKDGTIFPKLVRVKKGSYLGQEVVIAFALDITEIKNAEEAIKKERDQAQKYLDIAGVMLGVLDIKGNLKLINRKGCEILGYNENEVINKNWFDFALPQKYIKEVKSVFNKTINGDLKNVEYYENPIVTKNGKLKTIAFHNTLLHDINSGIIGVLFSGEDITLQKEALESLKKSRKEISELAQHLQDIREDERNNIAREIHDDLGQSLTALKLDTTILLKKLSNSDIAITNKLESMKDLTDQTIKTVQRISSELRPGILDDLGLAAAIEYETAQFEERTNIKCKLIIQPPDLVLSDNLKVTVFRLFQETCTNVARHSQATELKIKINLANSNLIMEIKDNGIGIKDEQIKDNKSFGIIGMKERLNNINGKIIFKGEPNKGTMVKIEVPLN